MACDQKPLYKSYVFAGASDSNTPASIRSKPLELRRASILGFSGSAVLAVPLALPPDVVTAGEGPGSRSAAAATACGAAPSLTAAPSTAVASCRSKPRATTERGLRAGSGRAASGRAEDPDRASTARTPRGVEKGDHSAVFQEGDASRSPPPPPSPRTLQRTFGLSDEAVAPRASRRRSAERRTFGRSGLARVLITFGRGLFDRLSELGGSRAIASAGAAAGAPAGAATAAAASELSRAWFGCWAWAWCECNGLGLRRMGICGGHTNHAWRGAVGRCAMAAEGRPLRYAPLDCARQYKLGKPSSWSLLLEPLGIAGMHRCAGRRLPPSPARRRFWPPLCCRRFEGRRARWFWRYGRRLPLPLLPRTAPLAPCACAAIHFLLRRGWCMRSALFSLAHGDVDQNTLRVVSEQPCLRHSV